MTSYQLRILQALQEEHGPSRNPVNIRLLLVSMNCTTYGERQKVITECRALRHLGLITMAKYMNDYRVALTVDGAIAALTDETTLLAQESSRADRRHESKPFIEAEADTAVTVTPVAPTSSTSNRLAAALTRQANVMGKITHRVPAVIDLPATLAKKGVSVDDLSRLDSLSMEDLAVLASVGSDEAAETLLNEWVPTGPVPYVESVSRFQLSGTLVDMMKVTEFAMQTALEQIQALRASGTRDLTRLAHLMDMAQTAQRQWEVLGDELKLHEATTSPSPQASQAA